MELKNIEPIRFCVWVLLSLSVCFVFLISYAIYCQNSVIIISDNKIRPYISEDDKLIYRLDSVTKKNDVVIIEGWAVQKGILYPYYNYSLDKSGYGVYNKLYLGIVDENSKTVLLFPTVLGESDVANETIDDGIDYRYCGFISEIPERYYSNMQKNGVLLCFCNPNGEWTSYNVYLK